MNTLTYLFFFIILNFCSNKINNKILSGIVDTNFFVLDSFNLNQIKSHMYGFTVTTKGILTDNYYKKLGYYEEPEPQGVFIMIRKMNDEIRINQDFYGSFGLYIYENKKTGYFALSNSFLLLQEYLIGKEIFTLNKDFADNLVFTQLCSSSIHETLVKEIIKLPSNAMIIINIEKKKLKIYYIDYKENSIDFGTDESLKIIDKWVDKWGYIIRSLQKQTDNISLDLSGGFDTRLVLAIILNSGIDLNKILINSHNDTIHVHEEDFKIASNISSKLNFKLNKFSLDNNGTNLSMKDSLFCSAYTKLGFHKEFYLKNKFLTNPRFSLSGNGGEILRGNPEMDIKTYIDKMSRGVLNIYGDEFYNSSLRLYNRSLDLLKREKSFENDFEISATLYCRGRTRNHFGKMELEGFIANIYGLSPLIDPDIKRIKYNIEKNSHDLIAFIYIRFAHDLVNFPFQGNRYINPESIKKAEKINKKLPPYNIKKDFNKNFYIDKERKCPVSATNNKQEVNDYLKEIFKSQKFINIIHKIYNKTVLEFAENYMKNSNFYPLRHVYSLIAIAKTLEDISLNEKYFNIIECDSLLENQENLFDW